jgi:excisionase family DNA binding protein
MKPNPQCLTISIEEAGKLLGYSRNSAYEAAKNGELPVIQLGHKMRVPRIAIERMLGGRAGGCRVSTGPHVP